MDSQLQTLLEELYALDPQLRTKENELKQILSVLLKSKPNIKIDESFRQHLRAELQNHIGAEKHGFTGFINEINNMKKFNLVFGSLLGILLIVSAVFIQKGRNDSLNTIKLGQDTTITRLADNAFGSLSSGTTSGGAFGKGGGAGATPAPAADTKQGESGAASFAPTIAPGSGGGSADAKLYLPQYYRYVYEGDPVELPEGKLEVLKKTVKPINLPEVSNILKRSTFGLLNMNTFGDLSVDSFSAKTSDGYVVNVNSYDGNVMIYEQYTGGCDTSECYEQQRIKTPEQVPADDQLINAAKAFLEKHKISLKNYGQPEINSDWRVYYAAATDKSSIYIPDSAQIIFPLTINGISVTDDFGNKVGINVYVRYRDMKVTSVSDLYSVNYQSSLYDTETDLKKIMGIVEQGGLNSYPPSGETKVIDVPLGKPSIQLMRYWNYQQNNGQPTELYVPALVFPVTKFPEGNYYKKAVVVPLIKQILDAQQNPPPYRIMETPAASAPAEAPMSIEAVPQKKQ